MSDIVGYVERNRNESWEHGMARGELNVHVIFCIGSKENLIDAYSL
jgi:hypothetical protein